MIGPGQIPPQGQKAFVRELLRPGRRGPRVSCVLVSAHPGETELEFTNDGGETAAGLRYVVAVAGGTVAGSAGNVPPGASTSCRVDATGDPVECVWMCSGRKGRLHVWSYDGRRKRLGRRRTATDDACFQLMYGGR
jgi:hypothetical protein